jgi:hypothetical protein
MKAPLRPDPTSGLDYDRCHDSYSHSMTTVMMNQASSFELDRESPVTVLGPDP